MTDSCKNSIILIDKPPGITSFDVIKKLKKYTGIKKIGHAGVLDKSASGLLVCATNRATKLLNIFEEGYKIYESDIQLGIKTDTYDISGNILRKNDSFIINKTMFESVLSEFIGDIFQKPPVYSNVKINGKRLYKYALENKKVERPTRRVSIYDITLIDLKDNIASIRVKCSKGTYIRTLANDIGELLGVYGCVKSLKRIFSYPFDIVKASMLDNIECLSVNRALDFLPALRVNNEFLDKILNGVSFCKIFDCRNIKTGLYRVFVGSLFVAIIEKTTNNKVIYRFILPNEQI